MLSETNGSDREPLSPVSTLEASCTFLAWRNSFWGGALTPTVNQNFLLVGSFPPNVDGPASAAISANYQVLMTPMTSPPLPNSPPPPLSSPTHYGSGLFLLLTLGVCQCLGFLLCMYLHHSSNLEDPYAFPPSSVFSWFLPCWNLKENQPITGQISFARVMWHLLWTN